MRVTKLALRNFRGINREFDLPAACIVAGPNFSGKSTIPIALRLACVGSMPPPIGKTGIWPAFAGNADDPGRMSVTATTDAGLTWTLEWERKKDTVSQRGQPPESCALPPVLCEPSTFWSLTGAEQTRAIFAASGASVGREDLLAVIRSVDGSPARVRDEVVGMLTDLMEKRLDANPDVSAATSLWLSDCSQTAKAERAKVKLLEAKTASAFWSGAIPTDRTKELAQARERLAEATRTAQTLRQEEVTAQVAKQKSTGRADRLAQLAAVLDQPEAAEPPELSEQDVDEFARADEALADLQAESSRTNEELERTMETRERLRAGVCPCCGNTGSGLAAIISTQDEAIKTLTGKAEGLKANLKLAAETFATIDKRNAATSKAWKDWQKQHDSRESLRREQKSLLEFTPEAVDVPTAEEVERVAKEQQSWRERVVELEGAQAEFARWSCTRDERDKAESDLIRSRCVVEVVAEAAKKVGEKLDEAAGKAFGETLKIANRICDGLLESALEFRDGVLGRRASAADAERTGGTVRVGAWIPHTSFSGTESLIGYAGFAVAVASRAPFRLVVMDELNRLTDDRKHSLVARILLLIQEGVIDQFVGCDPEASEAFALLDAARWNG